MNRYLEKLVLPSLNRSEMHRNQGWEKFPGILVIYLVSLLEEYQGKLLPPCQN